MRFRIVKTQEEYIYIIYKMMVISFFIKILLRGGQMRTMMSLHGLLCVCEERTLLPFSNECSISFCQKEKL